VPGNAKVHVANGQHAHSGHGRASREPGPRHFSGSMALRAAERAEAAQGAAQRASCTAKLSNPAAIIMGAPTQTPISRQAWAGL